MAASAPCVSATGFGSTVEPDENCTSPRSSGAGARAIRAGTACRSAASTHPSAGPPRSTAAPSSRRVPPAEITSRAPEAAIIRPVAAAYSSMRPSRTGG